MAERRPRQPRPARRRSLQRGLALGGLLALAPGWSAAITPMRIVPGRLVCLGGMVTEIVYALEAGDRLVGVDDSSTYPPAARKLPRVGYYRSFSVEGLVSLKPDLVIASDQAGPPAALQRLKDLGLTVLLLDSASTLDGLASRIDTVAMALGERPRGQALVGRIRGDVAAATAQPHQGRVLVLSNHTGRLLVAGRDTAADAILRLLGAQNVAAGQSGYKPISGESVAALKPDYIVTTTMSVQAGGGLAAFRSMAGIAATAAARDGRIIVVDDLLLLGFGPRVGDAVRAVAAGMS